MATMTRSDLVEKMKGRKGAFFVTIVAETDPRLLKTDNPYVGTTKISRVNGLLNWIYENAVNNQRFRENQPLDNNGEVEQFTALPRKWGVRVKREDGTVTPLVEHKEKQYLELKVQQALATNIDSTAKPSNRKRSSRSCPSVRKVLGRKWTTP